MKACSGMAEVASLMGDPARARILEALADGRALTAKELAYRGGIAASTASEHLAKLVDGRLLTRLKQGRHQYFRIASPLVASMIESILVVAGASPLLPHPSPRIDAAMRFARSCYDHLAGRLGVAIAESLVAHDYIVLGDDTGSVTQAGARYLAGLGVDIDIEHGVHGRIVCRPCLDWSERRLHIAGPLGGALAKCCFEHGWIERTRDSRAVAITARGRTGLGKAFGIDLAVH
jgi:DNA-binding transcriptional ArsR family regulator